MKAIVLGFGKSGKAAAELLNVKGYEVFAIDRDHSKFENCQFKNSKVHFLSEEEALLALSSAASEKTLFQEDISKIDFLVLSSGIRDDHRLCQKMKEKNIRVISEADLAFEYLKNKCVGVTGTNGKTTTTMLIEFILKESGIKAKALGNIGVSLCSYAVEFEKIKSSTEKKIKEGEVLIVEMSSFQLESSRKKIFDIGVVINIAPDHLTWHGSYENYIKAKLKLKDLLKSGGTLFISKQIKEELERFVDPSTVVFNEVEPFPSQQGMEKNENVSAAYAVCKSFGIKKEAFINLYKKFVKPEHRIEFVAKIRGVDFINDSKSTNIASTIYAVNNLHCPIILIAGGEDKKLDFFPWEKEFRGKVKHIFLIGRCANRIKEQLPMFDAEIVHTLDRAVERALSVAKEGEIVLLSPGSSSYDQFKNYEHRGEEFKRLVRGIEKGGK